jgi:hypothetical protein
MLQKYAKYEILALILLDLQSVMLRILEVRILKGLLDVSGEMRFALGSYY